jgi:RNA polymerase sigma-70 factor (ECF subfamily)
MSAAVPGAGVGVVSGHGAAEAQVDWRSLVERIGAGDRDAETALVLRFSRPLGFLLQRRTGDRESARDALQETFITALRRLRARELQRPEALAAFLRGIALNVVLGSERRAERRQVEYDTDAVQAALDEQDSAETRLEHGQTVALVKRVIGELKVARDREVLVRFYLSDEDKPSICRSLGLDAEHFDRVLHRARRRLKALLAVYAAEPGSNVVGI